MDFSQIANIVIPEGEVFSISAGGQTLWSKGEAPTPPPAADYIFVSGNDTYVLDYQITTGTEYAIADLEYTLPFNSFTTYGWNRMIGYYTSNTNKWFLGCYKGGYLNPGTQFGSGGDKTLSINYLNYSSIARRNLWHYGLSFLLVTETSGNWVDGTLVGQASGGGTNWTAGIGTNIQIGGLETVWQNEYNLYGLRIYDQGTFQANYPDYSVIPGTLLAEYIPQQQGGVWGFYNTISQTFITKQ